MPYTRKDIIAKCQLAFEDAKTFYKQDFINYGGRTTDTNEFYGEVISKFLCDNINDYIRGIPKISRKSTYRIPTHLGKVDMSTSREEERIAIEMFNQSKRGQDYEFIGKIIEIQHDNEYISVYQRISEVNVKKGDTISQGHVIGKSGENALDKSLGNHLHFELYIGGHAVNPLLYINKEVLAQ